MPPFQSNSRILAAIKEETVPGTAAGATGAMQMRITQSDGLSADYGVIQSQERRTDGNRPMGRLGGKSVPGSFNGEISLGGVLDQLYKAAIRGAWAAAVTITEATAGLASITTTTDTIVASAGSWLTAGVKVGDVIRLANHSTAGNNSKNLRVLGVTANTITLPAGSLTANAVADSAFTLTILKKLKQPAAPVDVAHTIDQYETEIDASELFVGCRLVGLQLNFPPRAPATWQATFMGVDGNAQASGASPYFTTPAVTTGLTLVADDSSIRFNGADVAHFTGMQLNLQIPAEAPPTIGSRTATAVFLDDLEITGQITMLRQDHSNLTLRDAETEFEISMLLVEPDSEPKDCVHFFLPRVKLAKVTAPFGGGSGGKTETLQLMIGPKEATAGYDAGVITISTSAP